MAHEPSPSSQSRLHPVYICESRLGGQVSFVSMSSMENPSAGEAAAADAPVLVAVLDMGASAIRLAIAEIVVGATSTHCRGTVPARVARSRFVLVRRGDQVADR